MSKPDVKTDEKKQHFDDIYVAEDPVPYKERILDALAYVSDNFNQQTFDRLILPWAQQKAAQAPLNFVDLAGCFGNTTLATLNGMDYDAIRHNWRDHEAARQVDQPRRFDAHVTGVDISANALAFGESVGIYDATIEADLNQPDPASRQAVDKAMGQADIVISTAALVYLEPAAVAKLLDAFAGGSGEGYMLVNFLNPFALEEADATKRMLLDKLAFVGSMAARHRRMSELEQANHPGEEWVLLEIWVLKRRG
ncbi:MAG: class I SAM-dependent methyltransferase [Thiohalorhabdaceae bacterium]